MTKNILVLSFCCLFIYFLGSCQHSKDRNPKMVQDSIPSDIQQLTQKISHEPDIVFEYCGRTKELAAVSEAEAAGSDGTNQAKNKTVEIKKTLCAISRHPLLK